MNMQGPEEAYRRLVERLFVGRPHGLPGRPEPELFVGGLPSEWDVPLPEGAVVIGSYQRPDYLVQAVLDVPREPEQVVGEVERSLTALGWRVQTAMDGLRHGGFMTEVSSPPATLRILCDDRRRRHTKVTASEGEGGMTDLRINLNSNPEMFSPCEYAGPVHRPPSHTLFPPLIPPPGMTQRGGGSSGSGSSVSTHSTLFGELSPADIEQHYRTQLLAAGWQVDDNGASGRWAWSTWQFADERQSHWTALLSVAAPPGRDNQREVYLQASMSGQGGGSGGTVRLFRG